MNATVTFHDLKPRISLLVWLSGVFARETEAAAIDYYRSGEGTQFLAWLAENPGLDVAAEAIREAVGGPASSEDTAFQLAGAYAHLFLGAGGPDATAPYESVWREERRLCGEATTVIEEMLNRHGLHVSLGEPADHISIELQLLAHLISTGSPDVEILLDRMRGWAPRFCAAVAATDINGFYAAAAVILASVLDRDLEL